MPRRTTWFDALLAADMSVPLAVAGLGLLGVGWLFGISVMLKALAYAFAAGLILAILVLPIHGERTRTDEYISVRDVVGGTIVRDRLFHGRRLIFRHRDARAWLRVVDADDGDSSVPKVEFAIAWPARDLRLEVRPEGLLSLTGRLFGVRGIKTGRLAFDDAFHVGTNATDRALQLLTPEVCRRVAALPERRRLLIRIGGGWLRIRSRYEASDMQLPDFTAAALALSDALRNADESR